MLVCLLVKMLHILVLCPVLLIGGVQTLTIDSQLGTSVEDCFERVSIGEQLPNSAIYRNVSELTTRECEQICKQDKQCQTYDYGVGAKGNATCNLSTQSEKEVKDKSILTRHPDYDVYVRRFHCEQSPPTPIQPLQDELEGGRPSNDRPIHRPVFRPDVDERPLADDYLVSGDIDPYNTGSKPQSPYRPDDISQRPAYDIGPSYGDFMPQDIPYPDRPRPDSNRPNDLYRPNKPPRPQDHYRPDRPDPYRPDRPNDPYRPETQDPYRPASQDPYRPNRPEPLDPYRPQSDPYLQKPKPESNDVLHFDGYGNPIPVYPANKPDPYRPEKPNYNYIIRPNRKPRPQDEYNKPTKPIESLDVGQYGHLSGPVGPPYKPNTPDKPSYSYNSQYASNYGSNTQNDNSVYVEIYDPPRPYVPIKDRPVDHSNDQGFLGYGTYSSQNSYTQNSQNSGSYTGSITEIGYGQKPDRPYVKPQKPYDQNDGRPGYGNKPSNPNKGSYQSYGQNDYNSQSSQGGYGFDSNKRPTNSYQRPNDRYKPQGNQNSYGGNQQTNQESYGSSNSGQSQSYGSSYEESNRPSYNHDQGETGYQKPQPSYNKPTYGGDKGDYGSNQGSYGGSQASYGSNQESYKGSTTQSSYGSVQSSYGSSQGSYDQNSNSQGSYGSQSGYGTQGYGNSQSHGSQGSYGSTQGYGSGGSYGGNKGSYGSNQASYGSNQASYGSNQASYGSNQASYGSSQGSYGSNQGSYGNNQGSYGNNQGSYGSNQGSYGSNQGSSGSYNPYGSYSGSGYGNRPVFDYETHKPSYGNEKPSYDSQKPSYGSQKPDYDRPDPGYGQNPDYDSPKPGYGNQKPNYDSPKPGYGSPKPDYTDSKPGYGQKPNYDRPKPGYGNEKPDYDQKPGYNERPDPGYGSTKPASGYGQTDDDAGYSSQSTKRPDAIPVYEYEMDKPTNVPTYLARPGGEVVTSRPVLIGYERPVYKDPGISYAACFRRVLAGRRALRSFVRKVVPCEQLEDCRRECAWEKRFHCESFNYRLDPSFRGKGICELMTKPIEAFDQNRDFVDDKNYDFYEVDRNSLEPNCPETLRGPGMLHSGFLSSKPDGDRRVDQRPNRVDQSGWRDRHEWAGGYRDRFYDDKRFSYNDRGQGNRVHEDHFVPYQIGQSRTTDDQENWGQYGGNYGGQYYKDRNDYHKSISHWGLVSARERPSDFRKSHNFDYHSLGKTMDFGLSRNDFHDIRIDKGSRYGYGSWKRGRWNNSGIGTQAVNHLDSEEGFHTQGGFHSEGRFHSEGGLHLEGGFLPQGREEPNEDIGNHGSNECFSRRRPGMSLKTGAIRRSLVAENVVECEAACFGEREFKCVSYSYRYSSSRGTDNCFLSERPYRGLEMSADSGSDVYAMPQDKGCAVASNRPWVESECFWHVRSDTAVSGGAVKSTLTVAGLGACEAECIRAQGFFCRGFSFRFDSPTIGDEGIHNCILTSSPTTGLSQTATSGHELYARGNYGRGCEPAVYDDAQNGECYLQYDKAAKLRGAAVRGQARVKDEQTCGTACTEAPFRCLSFSYNNNAPPSSDNCLLSEIRLFDLQRGTDYVHSVDDWLFAFDLFNSKCWRKVHEDHSSELPHPIVPPSSGEHGHFHGSDPSAHPSGPEYIPHHLPELPFIPDSGSSGPSRPNEPNGPYRPLPDPDSFRSAHEVTGPSGPEKTYPIEPYKPQRPDRPSFRPDSEIYNAGFRPPDIIIPYKPEYLDPEPKPSYYPEPRPSYNPELRPSYNPEPRPSYISEPRPVPRPGYNPEPRPSYNPEPRPSYNPEPRPSYIPEPRPVYGPSYSTEPDRPFRPTEIYPKPESGFRPGLGVKPGYLPEGRPNQRPQRPVFHGDRENGPIEASWRHYTVSGFPCRAGTTCAQNQIVGHWACEPEGGEIGSWDYCCAPTHRCGYSEGFHKPWCYVGQKQDQWRPCSEKYYPYHHHNTPHPSQGQRDPSRPHRPWRDTPTNSPWPVKVSPPPPDYTPHWDKPPGPYLSEADRKYWDDLYENGPKAYYDRYGNPLPGYSRVPTENRPYIRYKHNNGPPSSGHWIPVSDPPVSGLGAPRYWPVAYLHRGPPPNMTYYRYNEIKPTTERQDTTANHSRDLPESRTDDDGPNLEDYDQPRDRSNGINNGHSRGSNNGDNTDNSRRNNNSRPNGNYGGNNDGSRRNSDSSRTNDSKNNDDNYSGDGDNFSENDNIYRNNDSSRDNPKVNDKPGNSNRDEETNRDEKKINDSKTDDSFNINIDKTTSKSITIDVPIEKSNSSDVESVKTKDLKTMDSIKGIDDKLDDFTKSIEVLDIEDAKGEKLSDLKTLEAEERQIEAIGRLLASRRGNKLVLEKRSQKDLDETNVAVDKDVVDFNFGNRFPTNERRGVIKRISKDEIERERVDKSLEVSETTFVRPPRVLTTTDNIRKAIVNGKVYYDATVREQRDLFQNNTRKPKNLRRNDNTTPSIINNNNFGRKKVVKTRNTNPVRRVKRVYRKRYNPGEVRRRLLERDRSKNNTESSKTS